VAEPTPEREAPSMSASVLWLMAAKALGFVFSFALPLVLVRQLSQYDFGLYKQVFLVVGTAVSTLPLGFVMSAYYFLPRRREAGGAIALNVLLVYTAVGTIAGLAIAVFPGLLQAIFGGDELAALAPLVGLTVLLLVPASVLEMLPVANREAPLAGRFIVLLQFMKTVLLLGAALAVGTIAALTVAAIVHGAISLAVLLAYLHRRFPGYWRRLDRAMLRAQLAYALPLGVAALLYWAQVDLHRYVVANRFDAAQFALYTIGCFELPMLAILNESVGSVLIPRMSELERDRNRDELIALAVRAMRKLALANWPFFVVLIVTGRDLLTVLFTEQYIAAWPIFAINAMLLPFSVPTIACDAVIRAFVEHRYFMIRMRLVSTAVMGLTLWFGVTRFGLIGAISAVVLVNLLERAATSTKAAQILEVQPADAARLRPFLRIAAAAALSAAAGVAALAPLGDALPVVRLVVGAGVIVVTYALALLLLRVPTDDELAGLRGLVARGRTLLGGGTAPVPAGGDL
jgi:O-antigen/teichoic acid export membrane protein